MDRAKAGDFDAAAEIACVQRDGLEMGTCTASVARGGDGSATVVATFSNGFSRMLMFADGTFQRGNATMSGVGTDTEAHLSGGLWLIRVDDQRFEIPHALVFGGQ